MLLYVCWGGGGDKSNYIDIELDFKDHNLEVGVQWLSGIVLDSRLRDRRFEPPRRHCVVP